MIDIDDVTAGILASGTYQMVARVDSWRGGVLLAQDIPISGGTESNDVTLNVPESVTLTVPRVDDQGNVWAPNGDIDHPLAPWGQRLLISVGITSRTLSAQLIRRGWFYVTDATPVGDAVSVNASGLLGLIQEAELIGPVTASGTYGSMLRQLVEPALTVDLSNAPTDRAVAASVVWGSGSGTLDAGSDRLAAVNELLTTWPAVAYVDEDGILVVVAVGDTSTSSLTLTDGAGGTAMRWGGAVSRQGAANTVVARGYAADGTDVQATVADNDPASPTVLGGPFSALTVPSDYFSPLLQTQSACLAAARTVMGRRKRQAARVIVADVVPYLALQARDGVTVTSADLGVDAQLGIVDQLQMPLTAADGAMRLGVRLP